MARPVGTQMTISCLQCDWSIEAVNTSAQASSAFLEAAYAHANQHEQHTLEVVQRQLWRTAAAASRRASCRVQ